MPTIGRLLERKGPKAAVVTIPPAATTLDAARLMNERHIGSLIVADHAEARPLGIFTERDMMRRVVAEQRDPATTRVAEVMTTALITCESDDTLDAIRKLMTERRVRHLPVMRDGRLEGVVSIGDLNAEQAAILEDTVHQMEFYIHQV